MTVNRAVFLLLFAMAALGTAMTIATLTQPETVVYE